MPAYCVFAWRNNQSRRNCNNYMALVTQPEHANRCDLPSVKNNATTVLFTTFLIVNVFVSCSWLLTTTIDKIEACSLKPVF